MIQHDASKLLRETLDWQQAFDSLDAVNASVSLVMTGGGTGAVTRCFARPGASKHFIEAVVPYSRRAVTDYLGTKIATRSVSRETVVKLANKAMERARELADEPTHNPVGIALTAALPTQPPRDHQEEIYVALESERRSTMLWVSLSGGHFDRDMAEKIAEAMIWHAIVD